MILYMCNRKRKVAHCKTHCYHGKPHQADRCTGDEMCYIGSKKGVLVKCRPATKEELTEYQNKQTEDKRLIGPWNN